MVRVAVLNDSGRAGGSAVSAARVAAGLRDRHRFSVRYLYRYDPPPEGSYNTEHQLKTRTRALHRMRGVVQSELTRTVAVRIWRDALERELDRSRPDIVHVHNLHAAGWDIEMVEACLDRAPVVWTLHDEWAFTGSCAMTYGCRKYLEGCPAPCPEQGEYPVLPESMLPAACARRQRLFARRERLGFVCPSEWLARRAREAVGDHPVDVIPNPVDIERFRPRAKRRPGPPRLLVSSYFLDSPMKGLGPLLPALRTLGEDTELILVGQGGASASSLKMRVRHLGMLRGDAALAAAYRDADLVLHASRSESEGLAVKEAMACGALPVYSAVGGLPEVAGEVGWSVPPGEAFTDAIHAALAAQARWPELRREARAQAVRRSAPDATVDRYAAVLSAARG